MVDSDSNKPESGASGLTSNAGATEILNGATQKLPSADVDVSSGVGSADDAGGGAGAEAACGDSVRLEARGKGAYAGTAGSATTLASGSVSGGSVSSSGSLSGDTVASRRLAHGLSPEVSSKAERAELRRKEKEASVESRKRKIRLQQRAKVVRRSIIAVVIVLVVGMVFAFWLLRWGLHDDAASMQGEWRVKGTDTVISITDDKIRLTDEVAYDYVIHPDAKTLTFTFGGLEGSGRYRFSLDHSQLAIDDGEFDWGSTLAADIPWTLEAVSQKLVGNPEKSPGLDEGDMVLERVS